MARTTTPSFVRDPLQAAQLAALLRDVADDLQGELNDTRINLNRRQLVAAEQQITQVREWADELVPEQEDQAPAQRPTHIRPALDRASGDD